MKELGWPQVVPIELLELEAAVSELTTVKKDRSRLEYYYTCGPAFIRYLMERYPRIDMITYLDADLYFFSDPAPLFEEFEGHSIGVVGHHLPQFRKDIRQGK